MKKQLPAFLTGFLAAVLVLSLSLSAFAAITGKTTIEVGPINIKVKGEIFHPTDEHGNPVDVFLYNGTTYAPLRALAEAYGLEVSYDGEAKMAVVEEAGPSVPDYSDWSAEKEAAYQEFKGMWVITKEELDDFTKTMAFYDISYTGTLSREEVINLLNDSNDIVKRYVDELNTDHRVIVGVELYVNGEHIGHASLNFNKFALKLN